MELLVATISLETPKLNAKNVRLHAIGDLSTLPASCREELNEAMATTEANTGLTLILALSYSSKWEIMSAVRRIGEDVLAGKLKPSDIREADLENYLCTHNYPDPELMIRTSGEHRISNFLLWQLAYAEFYFTEKLWPEFRKEDFFQAIINFQNRERRFGKTSEQLTSS